MREVHMITNHTTSRILSVILLGFSLCTNVNCFHMDFKGSFGFRHQETYLDDVGTIGLAVGTAGLAVYGLAKLGSWLFTKSDETVTEQAQKDVREASAQYANITTILRDAYAGYTDRQACINNISESVLYELAKAKYHDADIAIYLKRFATTLKNLDKHAQSLRERIHSAHSQPDQDYETQRLIARMKIVENQIQAVLPSLTFAYDYLKHHESFFALFEAEDNMMYRYERDLHAVESYKGDITYLRDMIHQSVMLYQRRHNDPYPYHWYLNRLKKIFLLCIEQCPKLLMTIQTDLK